MPKDARLPHKSEHGGGGSKKHDYREGPWYTKKGECLQHVLRKLFYDTLLIIHHDYNIYKYDLVIAVHSREVLTEAEWEVKRDLNGEPYHKKNGRVLVGHFVQRGVP